MLKEAIWEEPTSYVGRASLFYTSSKFKSTKTSDKFVFKPTEDKGVPLLMKLDNNLISIFTKGNSVCQLSGIVHNGDGPSFTDSVIHSSNMNFICFASMSGFDIFLTLKFFYLYSPLLLLHKRKIQKLEVLKHRLTRGSKLHFK